MDRAPQFSYFTRIKEGKRNPTRRQQTKDGKEKLPPEVDHVEDRASTPQSKEDRERSTGAKDREPPHTQDPHVRAQPKEAIYPFTWGRNKYIVQR